VTPIPAPISRVQFRFHISQFRQSGGELL
jgi:hypothetical protein